MNKVKDIKYYDVLEFINIFDFDNIPNLAAPRGNPSGRSKTIYKDLICTFDIETTRIPEIDQSFMYIWQAAIGEYVVIGRLWEEFKLLLSEFKQHLKDKEKIVFYVHNLSYEFQFLAGVYLFDPTSVFLIDSRKVLKAVMYDHFEFRCSYLHTNMSLAQYTKKMKCKHGKCDGKKFDYTKLRTPVTKLSDYEMLYCLDGSRSIMKPGIAGSMSPQRVPIIAPSKGVMPMEVSTDSPLRTAQNEEPLPMCSVMRLQSLGAFFNSTAARLGSRPAV